MRMTRKQRRARQRRLQANGLKSILTKGVQLAAAAVFLWNGFAPASLHAMPANGEVTAGSAIISQAGSVMTIQQQTAQAAINWQAFNIAANEKVHFLQPGSNAIALNRVIGNNSSAIYGQLTANGKVFLVNQNGVYFAPGAQVNVGGLVASTLSITDADFLAGKYNFVNQGGAQGVVNQGTIIANNQGLVSLLAPEVKNEGIIVAKKGSIILAAGNQATLDFAGDGKVQLALEPGALQAVVDNKGLIEADGGVVLMTARAGQNLTSSVVNQSGVIHARSLDGTHGTVTLNAVDGMVKVAGKIDVSGTGTKGGTVDVFGNAITLANGTNIDASGNTGGGKVRIGGDWQGNGDAPHAQTVAIDQGAVIHADALTAGNGGTVAVWSDGITRFDGTISAKGGTVRGDGGQVETSGHVLQIGNTASVNASAAKGQGGGWLLDPINVTISDSGSDLTGPAVSSTSVSGALNTGTSVTITTSGGLSENGDITVNSNIAKSAGGDAALTLKAHNDIIVNADITSTVGKLNVDLNTDTDATAGGAIRLNSGKNIVTNGGSVLLHGGAGTTGYAVNQANNAAPGVDIQGSITTGGGTITMYGQSNSNTADASGVSLTGALDSGGGNISVNGIRNNNAAGGAGVKLGGTTTAGSGTLTVSGENTQSGGNGTAIELLNGAAIAAKNTTLIGNAMTFGSTARVTGDTGGTLTLQTKDANRKIFVGASGTDGLNLTDNLFSGDANSVFQSYGKTVIGHDTGTGKITVSNATFGNDVTLQATGANGNIDIIGALNAGSNTVTLKAATAATESGTGAITAGALNLQGTNAAFILNGANAVSTLAGSVKSVAFTNAESFTVGTAGGQDGMSLAGDSKLKSTAGGVTVNKNITSRSGANTLTVDAANTGSGNIIVDSGATVGATAGKLDVTFTAGKDIVLDNGTIDSKGGYVALTAQTGKLQLLNAAQVKAGAGNIALRSTTWGTMSGTVTGTGTLTVDTSTPGGTIGVGDGSTGDLLISTAEFGSTFKPGFGEIIIGRTDGTGTVNVGKLTVQDKLTVQAGDATGKVTFATGADLRTTNKELKLDAGTIDFSNQAIVEAGSSDLTLSADTISNWTNAKFDAVTGGQLFIAPKTAERGLQIGGTPDAGKLSVDMVGMTQIADGQFANVTIGRTDGTGAVSVGSFNVPATSLTVLSPGGAATINSGANITGAAGKTLTFKVKSMNQDGASTVAVDKLLLDGNNSGTFDLSSATNAIGTVAAKVGSLKLYNGSPLTIGMVGGVDGITATGKVELATDRMTVNKNVRTSGDLQIYTLTPTKTIQVGGMDVGSDLYLQSGYFTPNGVLGGTYNKIILGRLTEKSDGVDHNGNINIANTTFSSDLDIRTLKDVNLSGNVQVGSASPYKDLSITANQATLPSGSNLYVNDLNLDLRSGLGGLAGKVNGTGDLKITVPDTKDIYISDTYNTADGGYKITYGAINDVLTGFTKFAVAGKQNVYFDDGSINKSVQVASGVGSYGVTVQGDVAISGTDTKVDISGGNFTMNSGKSLTVSGDSAKVTINADNKVTLNNNAGIVINGSNANVIVSGNELALGANAQIDLGSDENSKFTLAANKLTEAADGIANITGKGTLNLGPRDAAVTLDVNNSGSGTGLVITQTQLNGGLFGNEFKDLTLGNASGTGLVTIDGVSVDNSITVQNGATGEIEIGSGGLNVNGSNKVTLKANKISNSSGTGIIDAGNGTINLYTNDLSSLTGSKTVKGSGTLGIATYNGSKVISLGSVQHGTGSLWLTNSLLTNTFDTTFDHYRIGNTNQGSIYVNDFDLGSSRQNTTLTAQNIVFEGNANLDGKILALNASSSASQTSGIITTANLALQGGVYDLTASANKLGTMAANAQQVKVKAETLTIGDVVTPANGTVSGITASGSGDAVVLETILADGLTVKQDIKATHATNGNITLIGDKMAFAGGTVQGKGILTVQQYNPGTTLGIGTGAGTLQLGAGLFNGATFKEGFQHVYLGNENSTAEVTIGGDLTFVDPTTIRSHKKQTNWEPASTDSITLAADTKITTTTGSSMEFITTTLKTTAGSTITTGGDLTLTVDNMDLAGNNATPPIQLATAESSKLYIQTMSQDRNLALGRFTNNIDSSRLVLQSTYFDGDTDPAGNQRVFADGYQQIVLGRPDGTGKLSQEGTTNFTDEVLIRQAQDNGTGKVEVRGNINTNGNNFTVESKIVDIWANINANRTDGTGTGGTVSLTADKLIIDDRSSIKSSGDLIIKTYTESTDINLGGGGTGLNLESRWFDGDNRVFEEGFRNITIGSDKGTGTVAVKNDFKVTDDLTIKTDSGKVTVDNGKTLDLSGSKLTVTTKIGEITVPGTVTNINTLTATSTSNSISFTNKSNTIDKLGNITAGKGIDIKNSGELTIAGTVDGNTTSAPGQNVTVWTKDDNLVLGENGKVISHGNTPVYLTAENSHFINQNQSANSKDMIDAGTSRWIISTDDSIGDVYGGLTGNFRRYGTDYSEISSLPGTYVGNGTVHKNQPVAKIYGEKVYGDGNAQFFGDKFALSIADWAQRQALDAAFLGGMTTDQQNSAKYSFGTSIGTGTNVNVGGTAYGTNRGAGDSLYASYTGANPLNYKVETEFWVTPKEVTVRASSYSKVYDGLTYASGTHGVSYSGFVNGQDKTTAGISGGLVTYGGSADGAKNAGSYAIDIGGNLQAQNYTFKYVDGNLEITKRPITVTTDNATRVYGAANPTVTGGKLIGGTSLGSGDSIGGVNVAIDATATPTANAGTTHNINVNGITFAEGSESNYSITYAPGTLTITKRPVTITADNKERIYGENNPAAGDLTYKIGEATADTGLANGDSIDAVADKSIASSATITANAGTKHDIIMTNAHFIGNADNYEVTYVNGNLTITPRPVLITAGNTNRVYGDSNASFGGFTAEKGITGSGRGLLGTDDVASVINGYKDTMTPYTNAGTYTGVITPESHVFSSGVTAGNYIVEYASGNLTITPRPVLITAGNTSRVYGDANAPFSNFTAEKGTIGSGRGLIGSDDVTSVINGYNDTMNPYTNVGTYTGVITPESHVFAPGVTAGNYSVDYVSGDLTITKAPLHITVDNQRRPQNAKNPELTVKYEGFKNGEREDVVTDLTVTTPAEKISPPGTYDIVADGGKATNYEITYTPGELLVYPVGAIEDVKTVTQPKTPEQKPAGSITSGVPSATNPGQLPVLPNPSGVPPVNTGAVPALPAGINGQVSIQSGGSTGERVFVSDRDGFGLQLKTPYIGSDKDIAGEHRTSGAIPVLYANSNNQKLDGIYTINYNPDKLSILPSVQSVTIPRLEEVIPTMNRGFSIIYKTDAMGSFEVAFGNGIVSIHPLDQLAVTTVTGPQKEAAKAVFATGILTAVEELGVMPDQVRAVYIFTEIQ